MSTLEICPVCCEGTLRPYTFATDLKHKNIVMTIDCFQSSKCDICSSKVATHAQSRHNKLTTLNFGRAIDGLLTTHEVQRIRKKLGLSQRDASAIIAGGGNSFSKYESGSVRQSNGVDNMLRMLDKSPHLLEVLYEAHSQRKAFASVYTEIYLPAKSNANEPSTIATFIKTFKNAVHSAFCIVSQEFSVAQPQAQFNNSRSNFMLVNGDAK